MKPRPGFGELLIVITALLLAVSEFHFSSPSNFVSKTSSVGSFFLVHVNGHDGQRVDAEAGGSWQAPPHGKVNASTSLASVGNENGIRSDLDLATGNDDGHAQATKKRRIPELVAMPDLTLPDLPAHAVPLPQADTRPGVYNSNGKLARLEIGGKVRSFNPELVLVKFRNQPLVAALRVPAGEEPAAMKILSRRKDVAFAELDIYQNRQGLPDDPLIGNQWQHQVLGSAQAWAVNEGAASVRIAIVDDGAFQMDHPDLAAHVASGWDVDQGAIVTNSSGIDHATFCAGLAAAVINNGVGVAGMSDCTLVPVVFNGSISEMYDAVIWAADQGIRVVNISWTGGDSDALNAAGAYLESTSRGLLIMAGGNPGEPAYTTNQPDIYCISMTDEADNLQSLSGPQVDFAAPGWKVYSTLPGGNYGFDSGTSYAAPIVAGVAGVLFSINPTLSSQEVVEILKTTAHQPNGWPAGEWNLSYGWGRIDFASAAAAARATLPLIAGSVSTNGAVRVAAGFQSGVSYSLWRRDSLNEGDWMRVTNARMETNGSTIYFTDPESPGGMRFYRLEITAP